MNGSLVKQKLLSSTSLNDTERSVIAALAYFDIFHYPLTIGEIDKFRSPVGDSTQLHSSVDSLLQNHHIYRLGDFYSLQDNPLLAYRRIEGNQRAISFIKKATRAGRFLQRFPFVRGVGISGSLSKNYADANADYDFFIITASDRLWVARTCMHLFKKIMRLVGRQHCYCMNYFVDEQALELSDRNIFCATEIKTLLPVAGMEYFDLFFDANTWTADYLPASRNRRQELADTKKGWLKIFFEWTLSNRFGNWLDDYLLKITTARWNKKERLGKKNRKGDPMKLRTSKHSARSNPGDFQEKVLELYEEKINQYLSGSL
jgi:hypothetical protein